MKTKELPYTERYVRWCGTLTLRRCQIANKRLDSDKIYEFVMQCRRSGLSDRQWCLDNDIVPDVSKFEHSIKGVFYALMTSVN